MRTLKVMVLFALVALLAVGMTSCKKDDNNDTVSPTPLTLEEQMAGSWLSAGDNVAPLLVGLFSYDSIKVDFTADNTVSLNSHVTDGAWTGELNGTYTVTESASGDIHSIHLIYAAIEQEGIMQLIGSGDHPDTLKLEVVQTVPDISATPLTPEQGFGADPTLGTSNIQVYVRQ